MFESDLLIYGNLSFLDRKITVKTLFDKNRHDRTVIRLPEQTRRGNATGAETHKWDNNCDKVEF